MAVNDPELVAAKKRAWAAGYANGFEAGQQDAQKTAKQEAADELRALLGFDHIVQELREAFDDRMVMETGVLRELFDARIKKLERRKG